MTRTRLPRPVCLGATGLGKLPFTSAKKMENSCKRTSKMCLKPFKCIGIWWILSFKFKTKKIRQFNHANEDTTTKWTNSYYATMSMNKFRQVASHNPNSYTQYYIRHTCKPVLLWHVKILQWNKANHIITNHNKPMNLLIQQPKKHENPPALVDPRLLLQTKPGYCRGLPFAPRARRRPWFIGFLWFSLEVHRLVHWLVHCLIFFGFSLVSEMVSLEFGCFVDCFFGRRCLLFDLLRP